MTPISARITVVLKRQYFHISQHTFKSDSALDSGNGGGVEGSVNGVTRRSLPVNEESVGVVTVRDVALVDVGDESGGKTFTR